MGFVGHRSLSKLDWKNSCKKPPMHREGKSHLRRDVVHKKSEGILSFHVLFLGWVKIWLCSFVRP